MRADQRRPSQADRQAAAAVPGRRRRPADPGEQRRDAGQPAVRAAPRRATRTARSAPPASPGTFLATITGAGRPPALYELPHGVALLRSACPARCFRRRRQRRADGRLLRRAAQPRRARRHARPRDDAQARQRPGLRRRRDPHRRLPGRRRRRGHGVLRPRERRPVRVLLQRHRGDVRRHRRAARRCGHRRRSRRLERWSVVLRGRGACATLDAATNVAATLLQQFPEVVARHLDGECDAVPHRARTARCGPTRWRRCRATHEDQTWTGRVCDGFGICAKHAPEYFSLDDWGYASLIGNGTVADADRDAVMRALLDCPVHAIIAIGEHQPSGRVTTVDRSPRRRPNRTSKPRTAKRSRNSSVDQTTAAAHRSRTSSSGRRGPTANCASRSARAARR